MNGDGQFGLDVFMDKHWLFNFDVKYIRIDTEATIRTVTGAVLDKVSVEVDPRVLGFGSGIDSELASDMISYPGRRSPTAFLRRDRRCRFRSAGLSYRTGQNDTYCANLTTVRMGGVL